MIEKFSYCRICEATCGIKVRVEDGKVVSIVGDKDNVNSRGYLCEKGKAFTYIQNDPDRVRQPMKRTNGSWKPISWDTAISGIAEKTLELRDKFGPRSIGLYLGNPAAFSYSHGAFALGHFKAMGTPNVFTSGSQDCNNRFVVSKMMYGSEIIQPIPDLLRTELLYIFGSNPKISHMLLFGIPSPVKKLKMIEKRGGKVLFFDPRRHETARLVGEHVFVRPDTDVFLLLAMINVVLEEGLEDKDIVHRYGKNLEDLKEIAAAYPPEAVADRCGVPADRIRKLARDFANVKAAAAYSGTGINLGTFGTITFWAIQALNVITGKLDSKGGMVVGMGTADLPKMGKMFDVGRSTEVTRIGGFPAVLDTFPAGVMAEEILREGPGQIKGLFLTAGNPLLTVPNAKKIEKALQNLELLVSVDIYINETASFGNYILPTTTFLERDDYMVANGAFMLTPFAIYTDKVVEPDGEQKQEWEIFLKLTKAMGLKPFGDTIASIMIKTMDAFGKLPIPRMRGFHPDIIGSLALRSRGIKAREVKRHPHGMLLPDHRSGVFFRKMLLTDDKKVDLCPPAFDSEFGKLRKTFETPLDGGLLLISQREKKTHNSWMHNIPEFVEGRKIVVQLHPSDAKKLEVEDGELVCLTTKIGEIKVEAKITEDIMEGVAAMPYGWGHHYESSMSNARKNPGVNFNELTSDDPADLETYAGMSLLNGVPIKVKDA